ncbi:MAG: LPS export ABC transporter permease LptG [Desulfobacterales bacterium]
MTLLNKYILKEIIKIFFIVLTLVIGIFITVDYLGTMDEFIHSGISLQRALVYVLLKLPFVVTQFIPVALLLSTLIVFGLMSKNNEILILKSSGISIFYLLRPVMLIGFIFTVTLVVLAEITVPITMSKSNAIKYREIRKDDVVSSKAENLWIKGEHKIIHIKYFHPAEKMIFGVTCHFFNDDFKMIKRIDAKKGTFENGKWMLHDLMMQVLDENSEQYRISFHNTIAEKLDFSPEDLQKAVKKSEEMNFKELLNYIRKVEKEGYDATTYRVDLYSKTAYPFVCLIMVLVGTGLTASGKLGKGLPRSIAIGLVIAFFYWIFYSFCLSLGYGELLPPVVAAWGANILFLCLASLSLLNAE